ncbi:transglutaminase family protein [Acinetobacter sp. WZC-1]|uniref:transglutaminase family protein n=1 Tax=Acinetobacter sp. WZC-1 TaxID=3459034 RepID=UPI00403D6810
MNRSIQISMIVVLSLIWLAQLAFIPVPLALIFLCMLLTLVWRYQKNTGVQNQQSLVSRVIKILFVVMSLAVIYLDYQSLLGVGAGTAVLATFLYAKALETQQQRDVIVLFNFALFVSASLFLYSQSMWMALLVLCCLTSGLVGLYRVQTQAFSRGDSDNHPGHFRADARHVAHIVALAIPFFVLLFLFFPRLPPLWQIPIASDKGVTGISDRMSPGDIASLSQSSALAFRIRGDMKKLPDRQNLYWRAMVLDQYDGTTWTSSFLNRQVRKAPILKQSTQSLDYQYLAGDNRVQWIMALEHSIPLQSGLQLHHDGSITLERQLQSAQPLSFAWLGNHPDQSQPVQNSAFEYRFNQIYLQHGDPAAQKLARQLFDSVHHHPERYIAAVLQWYKNQNFVYTLSPGRLGQNRIDEFLFQSRQGFCEHYASSFVMLMRYAGIPARVVVGYQGGQLAPDAQSWEVRQLDAHAWSEVLLNGQWQRIDPTAIIAPQRIDLGMQDYMGNEREVFGQGTTSAWQYRQFSMLRTLRVWSDYASYQWQSKVVGYDADKQNGWLSQLGLNASYAYAIMLILGGLLIGALYFLVMKLRTASQVTAVDRVLNRFTRQLAQKDRKRDAETFQQWMLRLAGQVDQQQPFRQANEIFQKIVYQQDSADEHIEQLQLLLKECADRLKSSKKTCHDSEK